jgi:hypothetical protein
MASEKSASSLARRALEQSPLSWRVADRLAEDVTEEINELYKNADAGPPATYVVNHWITRQAAQTQHDLQVVSEHFLLATETWKNTVWHNLPLQKWFTVTENVKGAVWIVDEVESHKW